MDKYLYVFTDEAGDDGLNSKDKYKIIVFSLFADIKSMKKTLESFKKLSVDFFHNSLRSWKDQRGKVKRQPVLLKEFFETFFKENKHFLLSIGIIEKNKDFYSTPEDIKNETIELYSNLFVRSISLYKRYYYIKKGYKECGTPNIAWVIDRNDDEKFITPLRKKIEETSLIKEVIMNGPYFLPKPKYLKDHTKKLKILSQVIEMTDNFSGAILRGLNENTPEYFEMIRTILSRAKGFDISLREDEKWKWDNVMVSPKNRKECYNNIIGPDYYHKK